MTTNYSAQNKERYGTVAMIIKHKHNGVKTFMEPQYDFSMQYISDEDLWKYLIV